MKMDWLLTNPQLNSTFSSLGNAQGDSHVISANALAILDEINCKLTCEEPTLRTYRRAIGFGQNIKLDLIPLLINAKDSEVIDTTIRILVNLTVPVECLLPVDEILRTDVGSCTIFELNKLLITSKEAFTDSKSTKAIIDYMKCILQSDTKLSISQCDSINNCLLLLRNILHIPEQHISLLGKSYYNESGCTSMQNIILWNLFIQSIDKLLIHLLSCPQRSHWGVTMVQLIALMYKDQHVSTLQKLLNMWFESSLAESSEDNESNTSPPKQGSGDSSPMLTSDPTSDSSDNGGNGNLSNAKDSRLIAMNKETESTLQQVSRKGHEYQNAILRIPVKQQKISYQCHHQSYQRTSYQGHQTHQTIASPKYPIHMGTSEKDAPMKTSSLEHEPNPMPHSSPIRSDVPISPYCTIGQSNCCKCCPQKRECCPSSPSEHSDCGYGTQLENQESISTSSNEDYYLHQKPKLPCSQKQRCHFSNKQRNTSAHDKKEWRRKKMVKRSKSSLINMKGLVQHTPTDEDISNILKEFTVDFLLKGYRYLVQVLHAQLLSDLKVQIDTSHFFWLVTYFLKFAAQLEIDFEYVSPVLSFEIISYLTYEGVTLCEQLNLNPKQGGDLKPYLRRIHLVVTAIREFLQALETYKKITYLSQEDRQHLLNLQIQICSTEDLRCLFILLIRRYNSAIHTKQYLQDLIVTNHILLLQLDNITKSTNKKVPLKMAEHIEQFATVEIMYHYGLLLEDFRENGEFVNDCIFTMMHHVGGDLGQVGMLFQPNILKTYSRIWETEYGICDDWSDLIEYVIHKFMNTQLKSPLTIPMAAQALASPPLTELTKEHNMEHPVCTWTQEEKDSLQWHYAQSKKSKDVIGKIIKLFQDNGNVQKSRLSIIHQLLQQNKIPQDPQEICEKMIKTICGLLLSISIIKDVINLVQYDDFMKIEDSSHEKTFVKSSGSSTSTGESGIEIKDPDSVKISDDIQLLKDRLLKENKGKLLLWLQKFLVECWYVKLHINTGKEPRKEKNDNDIVQIMEAVPYHYILKNKSVPLVPWTSEQGAIMMHQPFVLLLHKLGFHLPQDIRNVFARIPNFWTADYLYQTALKLGPLDKCELAIIKFGLNILTGDQDTKVESNKSGEESSNESFAIPRVRHSNSVIRYTPDPASTPSVPNWLQLVMRSKCIASDRKDQDSAPSNSPSTLSVVSSTVRSKPSSSKMHPTFSDDDSVMRSVNDGSDDRSFTRRKSSNMETESSAGKFTSSYDNEMLNCETKSVASDLTRMCVSDEEDKLDE